MNHDDELRGVAEMAAQMYARFVEMTADLGLTAHELLEVGEEGFSDTTEGDSWS